MALQLAYKRILQKLSGEGARDTVPRRVGAGTGAGPRKEWSK